MGKVLELKLVNMCSYKLTSSSRPRVKEFLLLFLGAGGRRHTLGKFADSNPGSFLSHCNPSAVTEIAAVSHLMSSIFS